jgi:hypothetical protein
MAHCELSKAETLQRALMMIKTINMNAIGAGTTKM